MGEMSVMDGTGDTKIIWDSGNTEEIENAHKTFKRMKKKGFIAYSVEGDGGKGKVLTEFDQDAERIILAPPLAGG